MLSDILMDILNELLYWGSKCYEKISWNPAPKSFLTRIGTSHTIFPFKLNQKFPLQIMNRQMCKEENINQLKKNTTEVNLSELLV